MKVEDIKQAIAELPGDERHSLAAWLIELDYDEWDKEMARDFSPGGCGSHLLEKLTREIAAGKARPLEEGLSKRDDSSR